MKYSKKTEPLKKLAERIKTDQTIPRKWARELLAINRYFQKELRKHFQALEILKGSKQLLEKVDRGEITLEQYKSKISHARQQKEEVEIFAQVLSRILKEHSEKRASQTREDHRETPSREDPCEPFSLK